RLRNCEVERVWFERLFLARARRATGRGVAARVWAAANGQAGHSIAPGKESRLRGVRLEVAASGCSKSKICAGTYRRFGRYRLPPDRRTDARIDGDCDRILPAKGGRNTISVPIERAGVASSDASGAVASDGPGGCVSSFLDR